MTARDVLEDAKDSLLYCMELSERLEVYRTIAERAKRRGYDEAALELVEKGEELRGELAIMRQRADIANALIALLGDAKLQTVLRLIYICGMPMKEAAQKMHYTLRNAYKLHSKALALLETHFTNGGTNE